MAGQLEPQKINYPTRVGRRPGEVLQDTPERKEQFLDALERHYGILTEACRAIGLNRSTYYLWYENDPDFKIAVDDINEVAIDFVEGKLFERINGVEVIKGVDDSGKPILYSLPPDVSAIGLYLKTRGKKRGYVERTEFTGADGSELFQGKSDEELKQILKLISEKINSG